MKIGRFLTFVVTGFMVLNTCTISTNVADAYASATFVEDEVQPYADIIVWKYKRENGVLYKRLYNTTTYTWVGDWIVA